MQLLGPWGDNQRILQSVELRGAGALRSIERGGVPWGDERLHSINRAPTKHVGALSGLVEVGGVAGPWEVQLACSLARGQVIQVPATEDVCGDSWEVANTRE